MNLMINGPFLCSWLVVAFVTIMRSRVQGLVMKTIMVKYLLLWLCACLLYMCKKLISPEFGTDMSKLFILEMSFWFFPLLCTQINWN